MLAEIKDVLTQSRATLIEDAIGVAVLFGALVALLSLPL